jgi:hypothetical protein
VLQTPPRLAAIINGVLVTIALGGFGDSLRSPSIKVNRQTVMNTKLTSQFRLALEPERLRNRLTTAGKFSRG